MPTFVMQKVSREKKGSYFSVEEIHLADLKILALHLHVVSAHLVHGAFGDFHLLLMTPERCRFGSHVFLGCAKIQAELCVDGFRLV